MASKITFVTIQKNRRSRIIINDRIWRGGEGDPTAKELEELRSWLDNMHLVDLTNFNILANAPHLGRNLLQRMPEGHYTKMLRIALRLVKGL